MVGRRRVPGLLHGPVGPALEQGAQGASKPIHLTVYDNYSAASRSGSRDLRMHSEPDPGQARHHTSPCPTDIPDFQYIVHAGSIASPTYYRQHPIETMDANVNGLRHLLDYAKRQKRSRASRWMGFLFFSQQRNLRRSRPPASIPTPEDIPGIVSCTGPARLLRRVQALRRNPVRELRPATRHPSEDGAALQQHTAPA